MTISMIMSRPEHLAPADGSMPVHGETTANHDLFRSFAVSDEVSRLEIFLPPHFFADSRPLQRVADNLLPPERRGKGILRFFPIYSLPEVWADGSPRVLFTPDTNDLYRHRLLRDRFAQGPIVHAVDTHSNGYYQLFDVLLRMASLEPVPTDTVLCIADRIGLTLSDFYARHAPGRPLPFRLDTVIHAIDVDRFTPPTVESKLGLRALLQIPAEANVMLYFGRLTPHSKSDLGPILKTFALVARENDLFAIGGVEGADGYVRRLQELAVRYGVGDKVRFLGELSPHLRGLFYRASDFFVFPSDTVQEMLGITSMEAQACGLPVVASEWSGMRETFVPGETGFAIRTRMNPHLDHYEGLASIANLSTHYMALSQNVVIDYAEMGSAMDRLLHDVELRDRMGKAARSLMERDFNVHNSNAKRLKLFRSLLEQVAKESPEDRERRRAHAHEQTPDYDRWLATYPTSFFTGAERIRITDFGRQVAAKAITLELYEDLAGIAKAPVFESIFRYIREVQTPTFAGAVESAMKIGEISESVAAWHVTVLAKQDAIRIE